MGHDYTFFDEQIVPDGYHDHVDNIRVPSKTIWFHGSQVGHYLRGPLGDGHMSGAHMSGDNFSVMSSTVTPKPSRSSRYGTTESPPMAVAALVCLPQVSPGLERLRIGF